MKRRWIWAIAAMLVTTTFLGACGGSGADKPAVCDSLEAVQVSLDNISKTNVGENGLSQLRTELKALKENLDQLLDDARAQFQPQADAVRAAVDELSSSVEAATADPNKTTLEAVRTAMRSLGDAVKDLATAVSDTC
jgi:ElaB/YqjD/DUF883 family membrane-anchored ribosome-binding protein